MYLIYLHLKKSPIYLTGWGCVVYKMASVGEDKEVRTGILSNISFTWYQQGYRWIFWLFFFFFIKETNAYDTDSKRCRRKHNKMGNLLIRLLQGNQLMLTSFWCPSWYFIHKKIYILLYSIYTNCSKLYTCAACSFFFFFAVGIKPRGSCVQACRHP